MLPSVPSQSLGEGAPAFSKVAWILLTGGVVGGEERHLDEGKLGEEPGQAVADGVEVLGAAGDEQHRAGGVGFGAGPERQEGCRGPGQRRAARGGGPAGVVLDVVDEEDDVVAGEVRRGGQVGKLLGGLGAVDVPGGQGMGEGFVGQARLAGVGLAQNE